MEKNIQLHLELQTETAPLQSNWMLGRKDRITMGEN